MLAVGARLRGALALGDVVQEDRGLDGAEDGHGRLLGVRDAEQGLIAGAAQPGAEGPGAAQRRRLGAGVERDGVEAALAQRHDAGQRRGHVGADALDDVAELLVDGPLVRARLQVREEGRRRVGPQRREQQGAAAAEAPRQRRRRDAQALGDDVQGHLGPLRRHRAAHGGQDLLI